MRLYVTYYGHDINVDPTTPFILVYFKRIHEKHIRQHIKQANYSQK